MKADSIKNASWEDLVFEGKNKEYGAYVLRQSYNKLVLRASLIALFFFVVALSAQYWSKLFEDEKVVEETVTRTVKYTDLAPPPPIDKNTPPPPKVNVPPPVKTIIKFLPPKVTEKEIEEEEPMPTIEEIKENETGAENIEGTGDVIFDQPVEEVIGTPEEEEQVYTFVEQSPEFEGGLSAMNKFLSKNLKYPSQAQRMGIEGTVYVSFVVGSDGKINDVTVAKGLGAGCDEEAIRVIKTMPHWRPGKQNGKAVKVKFMLPIRFKLQ